MSVGRMINKAISLSERVDDLKTIEAKLFFTWSIVHTDDFGLLPKSIKKLKAVICPHWENTQDDISEWVDDMVSQKLWSCVTFHEEEFYFVMNFFEHQNLRKDINPKLWSSRGAEWDDFDTIKNQLDSNLFSSIGKKSEIAPIKKKKVRVKRVSKDTVDDVRKEILNHKQFPTLKKKYPYREYEEIIEDMCEWWMKNKKSLPKTPILAFKNWLTKTKPDEDLLEKSRLNYEEDRTRKMLDENKDVEPVSAETLQKLKEGKGRIGNMPT